jgi:hypothetical protein
MISLEVYGQEIDTSVNSPVDMFVENNSFENWDLEG